MKTSKNILQKDRTCFHVALICWALAAMGMIWAVSFNISSYRTALLEARNYQEEKAREVESYIRNYCNRATQLADTLRVFIEHYEGTDRKQIEEYLSKVLESAPREFIYGTGVWWEPYAFDPALKHFAPYTYRKEPGSVQIMTYEWSTEAYDYHQKFWYRSGSSQQETAMITDPYVEEDIAYISLLKPFFNRRNGRKKGLISVDLAVPQLQNLLTHMKTKPSEVIMLAGSAGRLIAHSRPDKLLQEARRLLPQQAIKRIVEVPLSVGLVGMEERLTHSSTMQNLGWTVVVISHPDEILAGYYQARRVIALATIVYLVIIVLGYYTICYFMQSLERQKHSSMSAEKMASLGEMAGSIAHEINNPLAIIQGAAQKMQIRLRNEEFNREDLQLTVGVVLKTAERIARIVRSLSFVARDGSLDPLENNNIRSIIEETLILCEARLKTEDIAMETSAIPADLSCVCRGVQISQVLINLINNAMDAIRELPEKWIRIEATAQDKWISIAVTDSGKGIPEELVEKIMKPFFTTKAVGKGTGLGLSISRGIAQAHGGDLELDRTSPHTRFVLKLPRASETPQFSG